VVAWADASVDRSQMQKPCDDPASVFSVGYQEANHPLGGNIYCMRLEQGCLRPAEIGAKMRATGGLWREKRAADEPQNWALPGGA
jgi:hypothetical protein